MSVNKYRTFSKFRNKYKINVDLRMLNMAQSRNQFKYRSADWLQILLRAEFVDLWMLNIAQSRNQYKYRSADWISQISIADTIEGWIRH